MAVTRLRPNLQQLPITASALGWQGHTMTGQPRIPIGDRVTSQVEPIPDNASTNVNLEMVRNTEVERKPHRKPSALCLVDDLGMSSR